VILLGHLDNGLGFYRFSYNGSDKAYVGVIAQEVQQVVPRAVTRDQDGYLRVNYDRLGVKFESYRHWLGSGAKIPYAKKSRLPRDFETENVGTTQPQRNARGEGRALRPQAR
jgi:hypothetical protein